MPIFLAMRPLFLAMAFFALGLLFLTQGFSLGIGMGVSFTLWQQPGSGLWPFALGLVSMILGFSNMLALFANKTAHKENLVNLLPLQAESFKAPLMVLAFVLLPGMLWLCLLEGAGWILATSLALALASFLAGNSWRYTFWLCAATVGAVWLLLVWLLNWPLPQGWWW